MNNNEKKNTPQCRNISPLKNKQTNKFFGVNVKMNLCNIFFRNISCVRLNEKLSLFLFIFNFDIRLNTLKKKKSRLLKIDLNQRQQLFLIDRIAYL